MDWAASPVVLCSVTVWCSAGGRHLLAPTSRFHTPAAAEKCIFSTRQYDTIWALSSVWLFLQRFFIVQSNKRNGRYQQFPAIFHALHSQHPPACVSLGFSSTRAALATCHIIHRVNRNGFGWSRHTVSCMTIHNTDFLVYILLFYCSESSFWWVCMKMSEYKQKKLISSLDAAFKDALRSTRTESCEKRNSFYSMVRVCEEWNQSKWAFPGTTFSPRSVSRGLSRQTGHSEASF